MEPAGDDAVGGQVLGRGVGQQRVLHEGARVEQQVEPVADEELALALELVADLGQVPGRPARPGPARHGGRPVVLGVAGQAPCRSGERATGPQPA